MMASQSKRLDALVSRKDEKTGNVYYTRIGSAWVREGRRGMQISVKLDALPIGGEMVLMTPLAREGDGTAPAPRKAAPVADDAWAGGDEEIPF
jgi:hypothetical protein